MRCLPTTILIGALLGGHAASGTRAALSPAMLRPPMAIMAWRWVPDGKASINAATTSLEETNGPGWNGGAVEKPVTDCQGTEHHNGKRLPHHEDWHAALDVSAGTTWRLSRPNMLVVSPICCTADLLRCQSNDWDYAEYPAGNFIPVICDETPAAGRDSTATLACIAIIKGCIAIAVERRKSMKRKSMKLPCFCKFGTLIIMGIAVFALFVTTARPAAAYTSADADAAVNAYLKAFVLQTGTSAFIQGDQNGGDPGFWQEIEQIEGVEDANDRTGGTYKNQVTALLNGFIKAHGTDWSDNIYNDDISWATIAYVRGYQATGNAMFRTVAKNNFDMMFARAWDPAKGALYWTTRNTSYNSCIECPAGIASFLLSQALSDPSYRTKAQNLLTWEKANLLNASSGAVWDNLNTSGKVGTWASTYNQGTFVGLASDLGDTASAKLAADYTRDHLGEPSANGYRIMPEYGSGGDNNSGLNAIGLRWISQFMKSHRLQSAYLGWLQANANAAWSVRRASDNLSWCQWLHQTPDGVLHSWDCISSVVALQVTPAGGTLPKFRERPL